MDLNALGFEMAREYSQFVSETGLVDFSLFLAHRGPFEVSVCANGHMAAGKYCSSCGEPTGSSCSCGRPYETNHLDARGVPNYCGHCGEPHEWTVAKAKADAELEKLRAGS